MSTRANASKATSNVRRMFAIFSRSPTTIARVPPARDPASRLFGLAARDRARPHRRRCSLGLLQEGAPDLEVELLLGSTCADLNAQGIDIAIRIGHLRDSSLRARRLGAVSRVIVGSPAYLDGVVSRVMICPLHSGLFPIIFVYAGGVATTARCRCRPATPWRWRPGP